MTDSPLQAAKDRLTIQQLGPMFFPDWRAGKSCKSPFREDRSDSFSVYDDGRKWKDFATGEGGDAADFVAMACGLSPEDGARKLIEMAGVLPPERTNSLRKSVRSHDREEAEERARKRKAWPAFDCIADSEIESIAALRGLTVAGVRVAAWDGVLRSAESREGRAWVITDHARRNAQGRLLSGKPWAAGMKAKTLQGAEASWPIGLPVLHPAFSCVALVEGGPDLLATYDVARRLGLQDVVAPVAMLGASNRIPDEALRHLAGKRVRIFCHDDEAGAKAVARWGQQLTGAGIEADGYSFAGLVQADGKPVKDLNDFARMHPDQLKQHAPEAFAFAQGSPCAASIEESIKTPAPASAAA